MSLQIEPCLPEYSDVVAFCIRWPILSFGSDVSFSSFFLSILGASFPRRRQGIPMLSGNSSSSQCHTHTNLLLNGFPSSIPNTFAVVLLRKTMPHLHAQKAPLHPSSYWVDYSSLSEDFATSLGLKPLNVLVE
jgi:hypothetical protein